MSESPASSDANDVSPPLAQDQGLLARKSLRILHVSTRLILGGSQENTILSCEGQARLGHDVHLAFGPVYGPEGSLRERAAAFSHDGRRITMHEIPTMLRQISPIADRRAYHDLKALILRIRPDVVHTHSSKAGVLGRAAAHAARRRGLTVGIIHTIHGPPFMPVQGGAITRLKTRLLNAVYTLAERFAARRCDVIVSVADAMTREFLSRRIGRPAQYVTVRSGMEVDEFLTPAPGESRGEVRARLGLAQDAFIIGTVARLAEHKGHDDLLDALAADLRAHPAWRLLWVGDGWWRKRLTAKARALGLGVRELDRPVDAPEHQPPQVILTGLVPPARVPGLIRAMDVLAHPSTREGLPRTVPQALLCGVVPVAYDVDGTGEACRDGLTGRLIRPGDTAGLRDAIAWLHADEPQRRAMAQRGRDECRTTFSAQVMVRALEQVYARALREAVRPSP